MKETLLLPRNLSRNASDVQEVWHPHYPVLVTSTLASTTQLGETSMKRFAMAVLLTCALTGAALAGDIPSTDQPAPQAAYPFMMVILDIINAVAP
jgi:hypothetical protein